MSTRSPLKEALAVFEVQKARQHAEPVPTLSELAKRVGCSRSSLYRMPVLSQLLLECKNEQEVLKEERREEMPCGFFTSDENGHRSVEASYEETFFDDDPD